MCESFQCDWCHREPWPRPVSSCHAPYWENRHDRSTDIKPQTLFSLIIPWGWWMMDSCTDLGSEVIHACLFSTTGHQKVQINSNLKINKTRMLLVSFKNLYTIFFYWHAPSIRHCIRKWDSTRGGRQIAGGALLTIAHRLVTETSVWQRSWDWWLPPRDWVCKSDGAFWAKQKQKEGSLGWWLMSSTIRVCSNGCQC